MKFQKPLDAINSFLDAVLEVNEAFSLSKRVPSVDHRFGPESPNLRSRSPPYADLESSRDQLSLLTAICP